MKGLNIVRAIAMAFCLACAGLLAVSMAPSEVQAQDNEVITIDFIGFSALDPDYYAIVQSSKLAGKSLVIYKIGSDKAVLVYPLKGTSVSKALAAKQVKDYGIQTEGHVAGFVAPAGYQLGGSVIGANMALTLSAGGQSMKLGDAQIFTDPTKTKMAQVKVKNAYWTADSSRLVVIINQKLGGDWPIDMDMVAAFILG